MAIKAVFVLPYSGQNQSKPLKLFPRCMQGYNFIRYNSTSNATQQPFVILNVQFWLYKYIQCYVFCLDCS